MGVVMKSVSEITVHTHKSGLKMIRWTENGKCHTIYGKTVRDVRKKYILQKKQTKKPNRQTYTFLEWYEKWLHLYKSELKENSKNIIKGIFNKYILPKIGKKPLRRVDSQTLQSIFNNMTKYPRQCTVAYMQVNACLNQAYKLNLITHNPCLACVIKKNKGNKGRALTKQEQQTLLEYVKTHHNPLNRLILIYLNTGMRCSELVNLQQEDINRQTNEIHIKGTKTKNSDRVIQTSKQVIDLIPTTLRPFDEWNKDKIDREFKKITKALKFNRITIHSLRHTFATNCVENGVDMVVLQKWLGHASITMTIDRYTHISEDYKREQQSKVKIIQ